MEPTAQSESPDGSPSQVEGKPTTKPTEKQRNQQTNKQTSSFRSRGTEKRLTMASLIGRRIHYRFFSTLLDLLLLLGGHGVEASETKNPTRLGFVEHASCTVVGLKSQKNNSVKRNRDQALMKTIRPQPARERKEKNATHTHTHTHKKITHRQTKQRSR